MKRYFSKISDPGEPKLKSIIKFASFLFTKPGFDLFKKIAKRSVYQSGIIKPYEPDYDGWIKKQLEDGVLTKEFEAIYSTLKVKPTIKVIITAPPGETKQNDGANSVDDQLYQCENVAPPDYVLLMRHDSSLTRNCLFEFARHINEYPSHDIVYVDEDIAEDYGKFSDPHFKPDWSPDTFLSRDYIGGTFFVRTNLFDKVADQVTDRDLNNNYDLLLRATELTNNIGHIPKILCHSRRQPSLLTRNVSAKKALESALIRRGIKGEVMDTGTCEAFHIKYEIKSLARVSIIIPTKDNVPLLKTALDSIIRNTDYPEYEIIVLNNNSTQPQFFQLMDNYKKKYPAVFRCINASFPFNFARLMNLGVAHSNGGYILMCNNDIEVIRNDWMKLMVSYAQNSKTGAVGVKLLYPDNTVQHAGIVLNTAEAGHVFLNIDKNNPGYSNSLNATTNYSAVTGACLMCRKDLFNQVGGMDDALEVEYNDIDLCLKFMAKGYHNVYLPSVELLHHESATRGHPFRNKAAWRQHERELGIFKSKWGGFMGHDPYYSSHLDLDGNFSG